MVLGWFALLAMQVYNEVIADAPSKPVAFVLGEAGAVVFAAAWLWSLITSLSILREARACEPAIPPNREA